MDKHITSSKKNKINSQTGVNLAHTRIASNVAIPKVSAFLCVKSICPIVTYKI